MKRFAGLLLLAAAIAVVLFYSMKHKPSAVASSPDRITVKGLVGGEKSGLLDDEQVKKILADRYNIAIDYSKRGSIEMVSGDVAGNDFLWPSSQFAAQLFLDRQQVAKSETIFNSPIVFYSWNIVTDALTNQKLVQKHGATYYLSDAPGLVKLISGGAKWKDVGLPQLYGKVTIYSTDPTRSNSGTMFAALLTTLLNDGDVPDDASADKHLPELKQFFSRMGYTEGSSADLFKQFLNTGVGANPLIVGYENQMIEYSIEHADQLAVLQQSVRVIYPQPTMWSGHPLIALTPNGQKLLDALKDRDIQRLAWERHGFRSGLLGVENDLRGLKVGGIPPRIESVVPMPNSGTMSKVLGALETK
jgi:hypothetical protein